MEESPMDRISRDGSVVSGDPIADNGHMDSFVRQSVTDALLAKEFVEITEKYEEMTKALVESRIPSRRAEIILQLVNAATPPRTYKDVAHMVGLSPGRINQIIQSERRRIARQNPTAANPEPSDDA